MHADLIPEDANSEDTPKSLIELGFTLEIISLLSSKTEKQFFAVLIGISIAYIVSSILFIIGIKRLGKVTTARQGNFLSALGMFIAICATLFKMQIIPINWILLESLGKAVVRDNIDKDTIFRIFGEM